MLTPASTVQSMFAVIVAGVVVGAIAPDARAGVVRHDVAPDRAVERAAAGEFAAVGQLLIGGELRGAGTLIRERWVLTSAHVAADRRGGGSWSFDLEGEAYDVAEVLLHPDWTSDVDDGHDLALMRLAVPVEGVSPIDLFRGDDAIGTPVWALGYGWTGNGEEGITHWDGRRRVVTNVIESHLGDVMLMFFDPPGSGDETVLEGMAGFNDSGGPVLVAGPDGWRVAGTHTFIVDWNETDVLGDYGDLEGATRVGLYADWIDGVLDACPEDLDRNGFVEFADLLAMLAVWGPCGGCGADVEMNGAIDLGDLFALLSVWGPCPLPAP